MPDATATSGSEVSASAAADAAKETAATAATEDVAADTAADGDGSGAQSVLARLAALDVPGVTKVHATVQSDYATLTYATATPNAKGNTATIEMTVGACGGCAPVTKAGLEERKDQLMAQLGDLHAKNPHLVFEIADVALTPDRSGVATYVRSFVDDGTTRAAMHTLEVSYVANGWSVRLLAYPRSSFPTSQAEFEAAFTKDELVAAVKSVFAATAPVLWPPAK